jgi:hypothetical protein
MESMLLRPKRMESVVSHEEARDRTEFLIYFWESEEVKSFRASREGRRCIQRAGIWYRRPR